MGIADLAVLAAVLALLVLSAVVSGSETATTAVSRVWVERAAARGHARARVLAALLADRERLVGAILIANNLVNVLATALFTEWLAGRIGSGEAVAWATGVMTLLLVIFGEVLPKTFAIRHAEAAALAVAPLLRLLVRLSAPATALVRRIVGLVLRLLGDVARPVHLVPAVEYVRGALAAWSRQGILRGPLRDLLFGALALEEHDVRHVMRHRTEMVTLDAEMDLVSALARARGTPYSRFPVIRGGDVEDVVGIVHLRRIVDHVEDDGCVDRSLRVADVMDAAWFVPETTGLLAMLLAFRRRRRHMAVVVDEYGTVQGLVTLEDVLEVVVGEIADEKETVVDEVECAPDGSVTVPGTASLADLDRRFGWDLPTEPVTVAGLAMEAAGHLPEEGEVVEVDGYRLEVLERLGTRILRVRIRPPAPTAAASGAASR